MSTVLIVPLNEIVELIYDKYRFNDITIVFRLNDLHEGDNYCMVKPLGYIIDGMVYNVEQLSLDIDITLKNFIIKLSLSEYHRIVNNKSKSDYWCITVKVANYKDRNINLPQYTTPAKYIVNSKIIEALTPVECYNNDVEIP